MPIEASEWEPVWFMCGGKGTAEEQALEKGTADTTHRGAGPFLRVLQTHTGD